jgi:hypothetical protein
MLHFRLKDRLKTVNINSCGKNIWQLIHSQFRLLILWMEDHKLGHL